MFSVRIRTLFIYSFSVVTLLSSPAFAVERARDLGIPFEGQTGKYNAITDVAGVGVGQVTLISDSALGPVRTGVTVISPGAATDPTGPAAGFFSFNGTGEMTGTQLINEYGAFFGPLALTGTTSVGTVRDALYSWAEKYAPLAGMQRLLPVVGETYDGALNTGTVSAQEVWKALADVKSGTVGEGAVGGGTGMIAFDFKGGIGTSSRVLTIGGHTYTIGVLVQANFGRRKQLMITGVPVGEEMANTLTPIIKSAPPGAQTGSIVVIIATDAPLDSRQLARVARRGVLGLGRTGSIGENLSGDLFLAFSNTNRVDLRGAAGQGQVMLADACLNPLFEATVQATEESIINALVAGQDMSGLLGTVFGVPHADLRDLIARATAWRKPAPPAAVSNACSRI